MTSFGKIAIFLLLVGGFGAALVAADVVEPDPELRVVRVYYKDVADARALQDYDLWEYNNTRERYFLVSVAVGRLDELGRLGMRYEVDAERTAELLRPRVLQPIGVGGIPGYSCYRTVEETFATAAGIVLANPGLATWIDVGDSWEKQAGLGGWDLRVLRLTNSAVPGPKPKLFITGSIHAREYAPAELVTRFAESLIDGYGRDADATWLIDYHEIHLMLQANPDGRKQAEAGLLWRKNTNQSFCGPTSNSRGVDLNRNFEYEWGCCGGASNNECNSLYRGPAAATEPEVQAIQAYLQAEFPDQRGPGPDDPAPDDATGIYIDIHASGGLVLWPWGFGGDSPNSPQLRTFGRKLAFFNDYEPQQAIELYPTDGTTIDYGYGTLGVASIAYELGTSFFQDCSTFESTILPDNLASLVHAAKAARRPYLTPAGPDVVGPQATPGYVAAGTAVAVTATVDDGRFSLNNGIEAVQPIAAAELFVDVPPWQASATPLAMVAIDGAFDATVESVTVSLDTTGLSGGRHVLFVRGRDSDGNDGAVSATFLYVAGGPEGALSGQITDSATGLPVDATVSVTSLGLSSATAPDGTYALSLPEGTWTIDVVSAYYVGVRIDGLSVTSGAATIQDVSLVLDDGDADGVADLLDCADEDPSTWAVPGPARDLTFVVPAGLANLAWSPPEQLGADSVVYDVLRAVGPTDFGSAACVASGAPGNSATDGSTPEPGQLFRYLVRPTNGCGGTLGEDSFGSPRSGGPCP